MIGEESKAVNVKVGVHQGLVLSPLLFIIVVEALSREFREGLLPHADDLVLTAETQELLLEKLVHTFHKPLLFQANFFFNIYS